MTTDLYPITASCLKELATEYKKAVEQRFAEDKTKFCEELLPKATKRRFWGLVRPIFDHTPTYEELLEWHGKINWGVYHKSLYDRNLNFVEGVLSCLEAVPFEEPIYLRPSTLLRLQRKEIDCCW